ncbi:hypothetical protein KGO95_02245 [Patescibacteria group bacterium]|nr:hypothetical protein [Patescibacteria group bacterium]
MEHPEKNHPEKASAAEQEAKLIEAARAEIIRLQEIIKKADAEGAPYPETPEMHYAYALKRMQPDLINIEEARILNAIMHADTMEAFQECTAAIRACRRKVDAMTSEGEREEQKARNDFLDFASNRVTAIFGRASRKGEK